MNPITVKEFFERFESFHRTPDGTVIIHPNLTGNMIELEESFIKQLKDELYLSIEMKQLEIDNLSATTKFALLILEEAF